MNSRQRVIAAINHRPHDKVPVDIGANYATGLTVAAYRKVRDALGLASEVIRVVDSTQMLAEVEMPVLKELGGDVAGLYVGGGHVHGWQDWAMPDGTKVKMSGNIVLRQCPDGTWEQLRDGVPICRMPPNGFYFDTIEYPAWRTFDCDDLTDEVLQDLQTRARWYRENTDLAIILNSPYAISNTTSPDFMCALILEKDEAHDRLQQWAESIVKCIDKLVGALSGYVDMMSFSGDAGSQIGPLLSPDLYREMIVPHMRRIPDYLHRNSDMKFFLHSCGSVHDIIDCFIDMGVDILNPLQVSAANMEPSELVKKFGGRIVFWGGGCDTQHVLPYGTEAEVRTEVADRIKKFSAVPGFVFSQVHNIQPDVPTRNILAMVDEVKRLRDICTSRKT